MWMMTNQMVVYDALTLFDALINSGRVKLDIQNKQGLSAFHVAVRVGNLRFCKILLLFYFLSINIVLLLFRVVRHFLDLEDVSHYFFIDERRRRLNPLVIACLYCHRYCHFKVYTISNWTLQLSGNINFLFFLFHRLPKCSWITLIRWTEST